MTRSVRAPRFRVYVVELRGGRGARPDIYVGSTALSAEERVRHHLERAGDHRASAHVVRRRFARLRPDLARGLSGFRHRDDAHRAELRLAQELKRRGYKVFGACTRGCTL